MTTHTRRQLTKPLPGSDVEVAIPLAILDAVLMNEAVLERLELLVDREDALHRLLELFSREVMLVEHLDGLFAQLALTLLPRGRASNAGLEREHAVLRLHQRTLERLVCVQIDGSRGGERRRVVVGARLAEELTEPTEPGADLAPEEVAAGELVQELLELLLGAGLLVVELEAGLLERLDCVAEAAEVNVQ